MPTLTDSGLTRIVAVAASESRSKVDDTPSSVSPPTTSMTRMRVGSGAQTENHFAMNHFFGSNSPTPVPVPARASDRRLERNRITRIAEEDPDIEYIGSLSWTRPRRPGKTRTKNIMRTAVKTVNLPIKLPVENPVSDAKVSVKTY